MSGAVGARVWPKAGKSKSRRLFRTLRLPRFRFGLMVLVLTLTWYAIFSFGPIIRGLVMSVTSYNFMEPEKSRFIGLENYKLVTQHYLFPIALKNTLVYSLELWLFTFPTALLAALALVSVGRGRNLYQFAIFIPVVVSLVAMALLFKQIFDPDTGIVDAVLRKLGLPESPFLTDERTALVTVAGVDAWKILGQYVVLLVAGLLTIPPEFYEAAAVDGAGSWTRFVHVTLPLLSPVLVLTITMLLIQGMQVFVSCTILPRTAGGPGYATTVLSLWLYNEAFTNWRFGFASAIAFCLFILVFALTMLQMRLRSEFQY